METTFLEKLANFGAVGIIAAVALWQVFALSKRLFNVIENNTRAMTELTILIKNHFNGND
jgi:hypothetical protein